MSSHQFAAVTVSPFDNFCYQWHNAATDSCWLIVPFSFKVSHLFVATALADAVVIVQQC